MIKSTEPHRSSSNLKSDVKAWKDKHLATLKSLFSDYCGDTGTEQSDSNFEFFVTGMYKQCRH